MARIQTNTTGTQPVIQIGLVGANLADPLVSITVPGIQDVTVTNGTGVFSYTTFSDIDTRKLSTPADNEISTNVVLDTVAYFGNASATANTAADFGVADLSINKYNVDFRIYLNGTSAGSFYYEGTGFITSLAPTVSPDAPVWVSPMTIAVDGGLTVGTV